MRKIYFSFIFLSIFLCLNPVHAQIGTSCSSPDVISALPYTATGLNTGSAADNYDLGPCTSSSAYMAGNDYVFTYTPVNNEVVTIALSNVSSFVGTGIFVTDMCPDLPAAGCAGEATGTFTPPVLSAINLTGGTQYFIIVSTQVIFGQGQTTGFDISILSCGANPVAGFTYTQSGMTLSFTNTSVNGSTYEWLFGDEFYMPPPFDMWTLASNDTNPVHTYAGWGVYTIQMVATNECGATDTISMDITLACQGVEPAASFTYTANNTTVYFTNTSTNAVSSNWLYGDEAIFPIPAGDSTVNPVHYYDQPGTYTVTLTVTSDSGCESTFTDTITVNCNLTTVPTASFSYIISDSTVTFTNLSTGASQYNWLFGDEPVFPPPAGDSASNPVHTYNGWGTYTVQLIASNCFSSDTTTLTFTICTGPPPAATFTYNATNTTVSFQNTSTGAVSYTWLFGDGTAADTSVNPVHYYSQGGIYAVELTAVSTGGCVDTFYDTISVICNLSVVPAAGFTYTVVDSTVTFTNTSAGGTVYSWLFGDEPVFPPPAGDTTTSPVHTYPGFGIYNVELIASNCFSSDTIIVSIAICGGTPPVASFTYTANNTTVTFSNTSTDGISYNWLFGDEPGIPPPAGDTTMNPVHNYAQAGTYFVELTVTGAGGCQSAYSDSVTVSCNLSAPPVAAFTYVITDTIVTFTDASTDGTGTTWLFGDEIAPPPPFNWIFATEATNPVHDYANYGSYTVQMIAKNCFSTDTVAVPIFLCNTSTVPLADFTYTVNGLDVTFTNTSVNSDSYEWLFGDEVVHSWFLAATGADQAHAYASYESFTVEMVATNVCGITDTIVLDITLDCPGPAPSASFTYSAVNTTVTFSNTSVNGTTNEWFFGDEPIWQLNGDTSSNPVHVYAQAGTYTVSLTVTTDSGCESTFVDTITVICNTVNVPVAGFNYLVSDSTVTFTNTSTDGTSYQWLFGDEFYIPPPFDMWTLASNDVSPTHVYPGNGTYTVQMIAANCFSSDTIVFDITICTLPAATFTYGFNNLSVLFDGTVTSATSFKWFFGDEANPAIPSDTINVNPTHTYSQTGTYTVKLIAVNECGADTHITDIIVDCLLDAGFTYVTTLRTVQFTNISSGNSVSYEWFFGDGTVSTEANPTHTYLQDSTYNVRLVATNGCGTDTFLVAIAVSSVEITGSNIKVSCWPNPVIDKFSVEVSDLAGNQLILQFVTVTGREIFAETITIPSDMYVREYDFSKLSKGVYFLKTEWGKGSGIMKIVIQ